jgi:hypothetical protein
MAALRRLVVCDIGDVDADVMQFDGEADGFAAEHGVQRWPHARPQSMSDLKDDVGRPAPSQRHPVDDSVGCGDHGGGTARRVHDRGAGLDGVV